MSPFKGAHSTPPAPWPSDKEKRFQEFPEAQGRVVSRREAGTVFQTRGSAMLNNRLPTAVGAISELPVGLLAEHMRQSDADKRTVGRWTGTLEHGRIDFVKNGGDLAASCALQLPSSPPRFAPTGDAEGKLVLVTNRKSYMSFRFVPTSVVLNDPGRRNGPYFAIFHRIRVRCRSQTVHVRYLISCFTRIMNQ